MLETSARLLRLLSLLQGRRDWGGPELAGRLGVSTRTLRTDVERLRGLGYPVEARSGVAGGYRLGAGAQLPPLLLDDDEAVAVAVGLRSGAGGIAGIEETSVRALVKLEQVLPARLRHRVGTISAAMVAVGGGGPQVDAEVLTAVAGAIRDRERLRFDYAGRGSGGAWGTREEGSAPVGMRVANVVRAWARRTARTTRLPRCSRRGWWSRIGWWLGGGGGTWLVGMLGGRGGGRFGWIGCGLGLLMGLGFRRGSCLRRMWRSLCGGLWGRRRGITGRRCG